MSKFDVKNFQNPYIADLEDFVLQYKESIQNPSSFFLKKAISYLSWFKEPTVGHNGSFEETKWFEDGTLNISYNCIDRHVKNNPDKIAIIWQGDQENHSKKISYKDLLREVSKLANGLKSLGVKKGDRVCIYMPMIPEAAYSMFACMRIGAIHSVVFGGFSPEAISSRILDAGCEYIITADEGIRGGKTIPLKFYVDKALEKCPDIKKVIVFQYTKRNINWNSKLDITYEELVTNQPTECACIELKAEDPSFILYTSGSTGKPKGVLHTTGGYLLGANLSFKYIFGIRDDDIHWCTADVGWITGHTYILYGPLSSGITTVMYEGVPMYPDPSRFWKVCDQHKVNIFYTAPTAIRALIAQGDKHLDSTSRDSIRVLGTVGEPINPDVWEWYYHKVGKSKCELVDTWWQTETGSVLISPIAGVIAKKPGSATLPFFGVKPSIVNNNGKRLEGNAKGNLCIDSSWPSQIRTVFGNHKRMIDTYFSQYKGKYFTGDGARRDKDGYYWVTGRVDDVLNVSGHRIGTAEVESAIVNHVDVAEAAVVGIEHDIKGQAIFAYVILRENNKDKKTINNEILEEVSKIIGKFAKPEVIQFTRDLPKTRSGKIMRRILRKIANNEFENLGDTTTLADPSIVEDLIKNKHER
jgi:acetyl-CoA synthetase